MTVMLSAILILAALVEISKTNLISVSVDFYVFWAAAKLALQGLPLEAFDATRIGEVAQVTHSDWMPWAYPPGFLMLVTPFGLLPFAPAWAAFTRPVGGRAGAGDAALCWRAGAGAVRCGAGACDAALSAGGADQPFVAGRADGGAGGAARGPAGSGGAVHRPADA